MTCVIRRKRFSRKIRSFLSQFQIKIGDFNHWYIPPALLVPIKYPSSVMSVLNWALGIFYQNHFFSSWEIIKRKLYQVQVLELGLSKTHFWPAEIWHSSNNTRKLSLEQSTQGRGKHWVISFLARAFWVSSVRALFLLVLAGI